MRSHKKRTRACAFVRNRRLLTTHTHCVVCCASEHDRDQKMILNRKQRKKKLNVRAPQPQNLKVEIAFLSQYGWTIASRSIPLRPMPEMRLLREHRHFYMASRIFRYFSCAIVSYFECVLPSKIYSFGPISRVMKKKTVLKYLFVGRHCLHYSNALFNIH